MKWFHRMVRYPELWVLAGVALLTRFWQLGHPNAIVFDEVYFREFASHYLDGQYFLDIHPPLIKLLLAGAGGLFGFSPEQVAHDGEATLALRLLPALAGAILVPLVYIIIRQLGLNRRIAVLGGLLVLLDNALIVESRFVLMDSFLLLFGLSAVSCYLALRRTKGRQRWVWLVALAVSSGAVISTKWSGLAVVGLLAIAWLIEGVAHRARWQKMLGEATAIAAIIATIYLGSFMTHFALLPQSGSGDAFMSDHFQSTLIGNRKYDATKNISFWDKFTEVNATMYSSQSSLESAEHPYASKWHGWPLMTRPVYYWQGKEDANGAQGHIYLLGNPVVWWGTTILVLVALFLLASGTKMITTRQWNTLLFLLTGYAVNLIPFIFINRPMFLYHYFFALLFAIMIACVIVALSLDYLTKRYSREVAIRVYWGIIVGIMFGFLYFLPITYGFPLTGSDLQRYVWFPSWR